MDTVAEAQFVPRKVWTRQEAHLLADLGFPNANRLELVEGELIDHMGKKHPHVLWQQLMRGWLEMVFGLEYVRSEGPTDVATEDNTRSEPEPDLAVTTRSVREYSSNPSPEDLRLIVEVSDTTLRYDLGPKARLYARAAIVEYWVIDITARELVVHRRPEGGVYVDVKRYRADEPVSALAAQEVMFTLDRL